jgi:small subunit ribosomal protein S12
MITLNQIIKKPRTKKVKTLNRSAALMKNPQKKGICLRVFTRKPKKPNSAQRKIAKVLLTNKNIVDVHIPGEGHNLQKHSVILVRGGRTKDLPGVKYKCIRGVYDSTPVLGRKNARSKYGVKKL